MEKSSENGLSFRKGTAEDIGSLESIRLRSIESCKSYTRKQLDIWQQSLPDWTQLIQNTTVCFERDALLGFVVITERKLDYLYVDPEYQGRGVGNFLVSLVETKGMKCDCNKYSEKVLKSRGWEYVSENIKIKAGETFINKWYVFNKQSETEALKSNNSQ